MAVLDVTQKTNVYETLSRLNLAFAGIVERIQAIHKTGLITPKHKRLFEGFTQELQAEINSEIVGYLHDLELKDWAKHGKVRQQWERYLKGKEPKRK